MDPYTELCALPTISGLLILIVIYKFIKALRRASKAVLQKKLN